MIVPLVDPSLSSSFELAENASHFHIEYSDNSTYDGDLFVDTLQIGKTIVKNVTMAIVDIAENVVDSGPVGNGIWGINFPTGQANVVLQGDEPYQSVLQKMKKDGVIKSVSYSLWLDTIGMQISSFFLHGKVSSIAATDIPTGRREKWHHSLRWSRFCQIYPPADWCPNHQRWLDSGLPQHERRIHLSFS